ncbi:alanine acetyltransferase [Pseudomonas oryzihabitans]|nr:alanine acetyltransferase [Pseudomonas psychrotolerans]
MSVPLQYPPRFAVTEAVELIDLTLADPAAVADYYRRNRQHLAQSMPRRSDAFFTLAQWQGQVAAYRAGGRGLTELRLILKAGPLVIGTVNFSQIVRGGFQACYLGYGLDETWQGLGLMRSAVRLGRDFVIDELGLNRIMANHLPENARSAHLLTSLGFEREGLARRYLQIDGVWRDHVLTSYVRPAP